jgi:putative ABC transport system ATP-binding protein
MTKSSIINLNGVSKTYSKEINGIPALKEINLSIEKGEIVAVLGISGSGKSTLLNIIGGIDKADKGEVIVNGKNICQLNDASLTLYRREELGFIFQFYNLIPHLTVEENISVIGAISKNPLPINDLLLAVGLEDKRHRYPNELSGGEQQRVAIARAIIKNPTLLLCDEITGALDYKNSKSVLKLLSVINQKYNTSILLITHNNALSEFANRVIKMKDGEIVSNEINPCPKAIENINW